VLLALVVIRRLQVAVRLRFLLEVARIRLRVDLAADGPGELLLLAKPFVVGCVSD
jgi:hypothetical protein